MIECFVQKFSFFPLGTLFQKISEERYMSKYLEDTLGVDKKKFTDGLATLLLLGAFVIGVILRKSGQSPIVVIMAVIAFFLFLIKITDHLIHISYELQQNQKDITSILVLNDVWSVWGVTGSIFELIQYIAKGNYPKLEEKWQSLLIEINLGANPEETTKNFFKKNQFFELGHVLTNLIHQATPDEIISLKMEEIKKELHNRYLAGLQKLSDISSLMMGVNGILPIILMLIFMIVGLGNSPYILSIPILTLFLTVLILRLGFYSLLPDSSQENIQQENEIGWFFIKFGRKLEKIDCQELALLELLKEEDPPFEISSDIRADIVFNLESTPLLEKTFKECPIQLHLAQLCDKFLTLDVKTAANSIKKMGITLTENSSIKKKVKNSLDAEKSRIKVIQAINAPILGFLVAIMPFLSLIGKFRDFQNLDFLQLSMATPWWFLIAAGCLIILGSAYTLRQLSGKKLDTVQIALNFFLFLITYYIGTVFISQLF